MKLALRRLWRSRDRLSGSAKYWEERYAAGGDSGIGSSGELAHFKARILNDLVRERRVESVIELGCGDGGQLSLAGYPRYTGLDVSPTALARCRALFADDPTKSFTLISEWRREPAELALSLDVVYHLVEDGVFHEYMSMLFAAATRLVVVYSSDHEAWDEEVPHVRHRRFTPWVERHASGWTLERRILNPLPFDPRTGAGSSADFYVYSRTGAR